jgi:hypothetical protein
VQLLRRCLSWSWPLSLLLASVPALAAPSARLVYVREPGAEVCANEAALRSAVAARLGYDPFFPWAKVMVVIGVRKDAGAYRAEVTLVDEAGVSRGKREVASQGDDCAPLVGALALTISLALDPLSLVPKPAAIEAPPAVITPPSEPPPPPAPPAAVVAPVAVPVAAEPATPPEPSWRGWAGIAALGSYGTTPSVTVGGALRGRVERGRWSLGVEARADAPTSAAVPTGGKVQAWLAQATLLGCARVAFVIGCGLISGGPLVATGDSLVVSRTGVLPYAGVGPRLGVEWPLGTRFLLEGFAQLALTLTPQGFLVDALTVYRQPGAAATLGAAVSARIF